MMHNIKNGDIQKKTEVHMGLDKCAVIFLSIVTIMWLGWLVHKLNSCDTLRLYQQNTLIVLPPNGYEGRA